jgi:hypothetical protein
LFIGSTALSTIGVLDKGFIIIILHLKSTIRSYSLLLYGRLNI